MKYATLKTLITDGSSLNDAKKVLGVQLLSGEFLQFAMEARRDGVKNSFCTVWKLDDATESLVVRHPVATAMGGTPVVVSYYPAECILSVHKFLTDTQITEDDDWKVLFTKAERANKYDGEYEPSRDLTLS